MNYLQKVFKENKDITTDIFGIMKDWCPFNHLDLPEEFCHCEYESACDSNCLECWTKERDL